MAEQKQPKNQKKAKLSIRDRAIKHAQILWTTIQDKVVELRPELPMERGTVKGVVLIAINDNNAYQSVIIGDLNLADAMAALMMEAQEIKAEKRKERKPLAA